MDLKKKIRKDKSSYLYPVVFFLIIVFFWQFFVDRFSVPEYILPSPYRILLNFRDTKIMLFKHTLITLNEVLIGYASGVLLGFILSVVIFYFRLLYKTVFPLIVAIQNIPKLVLAPLFIIWFGFGISTKIIIVMQMTLFPVLINTLKGLSSVDSECTDLMRSLSATRWQTLLKVRLPNSLPYFFISLKIAIPLAVAGAVISEFISSSAGLGYTIMIADVNMNTALLFNVFIILGAIGFVLFRSIYILERIFIPWSLSSPDNGIIGL